MKWGVWILIGAILLMLVSMLYFFVYEGFLTLEEANARGMGAAKSVEVCAASKDSCGKCLDDASHPGVECGWCTAARACIPRSGMYRIIPEWLIKIINTDPAQDCPPNPPNTQSNFVWNKGGCSDACDTFKNCRDCAGALACGWSTASSKCLSKIAAQNGGGGSGGSAGSGPIPIVTQAGACPPPECSTITDCGECTSTTGCGYCNSTKKCVSVNGNGDPLGGSSGSTGCTKANLFTNLLQCPCSSITTCSNCAQRSGCGYCTVSNMCINMTTINAGGVTVNRSTADINKDCASDKLATSLSQCAPGATLGNVRSESSDYKPTAAELLLAQDNTALAGNELNVAGSYSGPTGTGSSSVSSPTTTYLPSGNGMVVTRPSTAPGLSNAFDLSSPLESYVKLLVRSELASEGIPVNEPFQVNETQAPGNAATIVKESTRDLMKK